MEGVNASIGCLGQRHSCQGIKFSMSLVHLKGRLGKNSKEGERFINLNDFTTKAEENRIVPPIV